MPGPEPDQTHCFVLWACGEEVVVERGEVKVSDESGMGTEQWCSLGLTADGIDIQDAQGPSSFRRQTKQQELYEGLIK